MENKANHAIVGAFVVFIGAAAVTIILWLATGLKAQYDNKYLIYVKESVSGLTEDSAVNYNGVPVGKVKDITLDPDNPERVRILIGVEDGTPILTSTTATIQIQGITGMAYISLVTKEPDAPLLTAHDHKKYPVIPSRPSLLVRLDTAVQDLTENLNKIGNSVTSLLNEENSRNISKALENIQQFTAMLSDNNKELDEAVRYAKVTLQNSAAASKKLPGLLNEMHDTTKQVKVLSKQIGKNSDELNVTLKSGQRLLDGVSNQLVPQTNAAISDMHNLTKNLNDLAEELNNNPSLLIRGREPRTPGPGEAK